MSSTFASPSRHNRVWGWLHDIDKNCSDRTAHFTSSTASVPSLTSTAASSFNSADTKTYADVDMTSVYRTPSPTKRRRIANEDTEDATPKATSSAKTRALSNEGDNDGNGEEDGRLRASLAEHPAFPPASIISLSAPSECSGRSRVSGKLGKSAARSLLSLSQLSKPVRFDEKVDGALSRLPEELQAICRNTLFFPPMFPAALKEHIKTTTMRSAPPPDYYFGRRERSNPDIDIASGSLGNELWELRELQQIIDASAECRRYSKSEAAWNCEVHRQLLALAVAHSSSVRQENVTTANIAKSSVPTNVQGDLLASKMVDFVLVLRPPEHSPLESHIRHLVDNPLNKHDLITINQSEYTPLQNSPIAVSMETKAQRANVEEGSIQLGIWTAAWHKRMDMLGVASGDIITLPLLHVENADWKLYFAIDTGVAGIDIVGPWHVGNTTSLLHIYRLLEALRDLVDWTAGPFQTWVRTSLFHLPDE